MTAQFHSVGTTAVVAELLVGALLFGSADEARSVLRFVADTDVDEPASSVLGAVRGLALRGAPPSPQLVQDALKRRGKLTKSTGVWLASATTSGACSTAAEAYAAAVVARKFRSMVESLGHALVSMADTASEADIATLVERTVTEIRGIAARLIELRGEPL